MVTKKISELEAITKAEEDDVLVIVDTSEETTKKIKKDDFLAELQEENEELKKEVARQRANQLKGQGEGESIYVEDSADDEVQELVLQGNSKQNTTEGRNYLPKLQVKSETKNGVTATSYDDGTITVKGIPTAIASIGFTFSETTYNTNFYLHMRNNKKIYNWAISLREGSTNKFAPSLTVANKIVQIPSEILINTFIILCNENAIGTEIDITLQPSIELTNQETDFEKFTYGASPNPDYEQPIHSCGDNINEFDKDTAVAGILQANGTITSSETYKTSDFIPIDSTKTYYKAITNSARVKLYDDNKDVISTASIADISNFGNAQSFTIPSGFENAKYIRFSMSNEYVDTFKISKGSKATPYSPYGMGCITEQIYNENMFNRNLQPVPTSNVQGRYILQEILPTGKRIICNHNPGSNLTMMFVVRSLKGYEGKKITIKTHAKSSSTNPAMCYLRIVDKDGNFSSSFPPITSSTTLDGDLSVTLTVPSKLDHLYNHLPVSLYSNRGQDANVGDYVDYTDIMVVEGEEVGSYVDHKEKTYIIPTQQPMRSNNDVRDLFVKENGNWIERHLIREYEPNNDLTGNGISNNAVNLKTPVLAVAPNVTTANFGSMSKCNILPTVYKNFTGLVGTTSNGEIRIQISKTYATTYNEAINLLTEKGLKIQYQTTEPLDLSCTEEQIAVLEEISKAETYKGGTVVMSEDEILAYVDMTYIKDLQTYLDNLNTRIEVLESEG